MFHRLENPTAHTPRGGPDKKDDGGDLDSELLKVIKQGYGRRTIRGADVGIRVLIH